MADELLKKDPDAVLDYGWDWSAWLGTDTISTSTWIVTGATMNTSTHDDTTTTVWLSGGIVGAIVTATNRIVTAGGRTDDRSHKIRVEDK